MKFIIAVMTLFTLLIFTSCVSDDDFKLPDLTVSEPELDGEVITMMALSNAYEQALLAQADDLGIQPFNLQGMAELRRTFRLDLAESTQYIEGFVINSDASGNWFEELIIQDKVSSPMVGVRVLIDESPLFTFYEVGRKVFIKLDGLQIGDSNGVLTLGVTDNLDKIPAPLQFDFIKRSPEVAEIVPTPITISDFSQALENTFIELTDVQFIKAEVIDATFTFAGEPLDEFDGERTLFGCDNNRTAILSTSTFSNFKSIALPSGRGVVRGTLSRNFFGDQYNLIINEVADIVFEDIERCDPVEIDCGLAEEAGNTILFEDDFEGQDPNELISGNGWTNFIEAGTETWEAFSEDEGNVSIGISARVGSFNSGDTATVAWLITPEIDLGANEGVTLEFLTSNSFADGSTLELLFSSDWDGTTASVPQATWDTLVAATIVDDEDNFAPFFESGIVDLSCIEANGYIAFKYVGSGEADFDGTYELEGVQVRAN